MEGKETPEQGALREAREETGLDFSTLKPQYVHTHVNKKAVCYYHAVYIDDCDKYGVLRVLQAEHKQYAWLTPYEAQSKYTLMLDLADQLNKMFYLN